MCSNSNNNNCCPYGGLTALPAVLGFLAYSFAFYAVSHCSFLWVGEEEWGVGYLTYEDRHYYYDDYACWAYDDDEKEWFDAAWKSGKAMGLIAGIVGFLAWIMSTILSCVTVPTTLLQILASCYIFLGICSLVMLCGLATEMCNEIDCSLGAAAYLAIVAAILFFGAGVSTFFLKPKLRFQAEVATPANTARVSSAPRTSQKPEQATVTETVETINPDGTKTITTTTKVERRPSGGLAELPYSTGPYQ